MADGIPIDYSSMYCEDSSHNIHNNSSNNNINNNNNISNNNSIISNGTNNSSLQTSNNSSISNVQPPIPTLRGGRAYKTLDGSYVPPKHREQTIDLRQVVAKLNNLPKEEHRAYAMDTLNKHYSSVFVNRRKQQLILPPPLTGEPAVTTTYRAYIQYSDEKETFVVRVNQNTLRAVREKMPKRGNYRYFFKQRENTCEEVEQDDAFVPFHEKDGCKQIYCQVFPF